MAILHLRCVNCGNEFDYKTPYPTYVGRVNETETTPIIDGEVQPPRRLFPVCEGGIKGDRSCGSTAVEILSQRDDDD